MPDEIGFTNELRLDLMYLKVERKEMPILTIFDSETTFSAASFLTSASTKGRTGRISEVLDGNAH
jgi:hypothetical protein